MANHHTSEPCTMKYEENEYVHVGILINTIGYA